MKKEDIVYTETREVNKEALIGALTEELPILRAKIGLSQGDLASMVGVSRQTYSSIETKKRKMLWSMYLALILVFDNNQKTHEMLESMNLFPAELRKVFNTDRRKQNG